MLVALVAVVMVFGIPLSAILGSFWLRAKRLQIEAGGGARAAERIARLEAQNDDLRKRVEVLETIVTSDAPSLAPRVRVAAPKSSEPVELARAETLASDLRREHS